MRSMQKKVIPIVSLICILFFGYILGFAHGRSGWRLFVNGHPSEIPVLLMKNMYYVSLDDLSKLPGWKVLVNLSNRQITLDTPSAETASVPSPVPGTSQSHASLNPTREHGSKLEMMEPPQQIIEVKNESGGPPTNVRMTVQAAVSSLDELQKALQDNVSASALKEKRDNTAGIIQQAENLLWTLPRTRTLQADLQVALEDLQSQISLVLAAGEAKDNLLSWSHPVSQSLLLKYPDLRPCHVVQGKVEGLDVACTRKMMLELTRSDFEDVRRDLDQYR